jgi:hypothetical protein
MSAITIAPAIPPVVQAFLAFVLTTFPTCTVAGRAVMIAVKRCTFAVRALLTGARRIGNIPLPAIMRHINVDQNTVDTFNAAPIQPAIQA